MLLKNRSSARDCGEANEVDSVVSVPNVAKGSEPDSSDPKREAAASTPFMITFRGGTEVSGDTTGCLQLPIFVSDV